MVFSMLYYIQCIAFKTCFIGLLLLFSFFVFLLSDEGGLT